jgi:hypothetical protein
LPASANGLRSGAASARAKRPSGSSPPSATDTAPSLSRRTSRNLNRSPSGSGSPPSSTSLRPTRYQGVEPTPLDPPGQPLGGESHEHLLAPLEQHAISLGFDVAYEPLGRRAGYCSSVERRIVIASELPANGKVATLVHELAHAHGIDYKTFGRAEAELIVESVACIVCASVGLDTTSETVPYLAGWTDEKGAERITLLAKTIDEIARAIELAIDGTADDPADDTPGVSSPSKQTR